MNKNKPFSIPTPESDSYPDIAHIKSTSSVQSIPRDQISNRLMERLIEEIDRKSDALQKVGQDCLNLRKICAGQETEIQRLTESLGESDLKTKRLINAFDVDIIAPEELRRRYALLAGKLETALERLNSANERISKLDNVEIEKQKLEKENIALRQAHTAQQHLVLDLQESVQKAQKFKIVIQKQESVISKLEESLMKASLPEGLPNSPPRSGTFADFQARKAKEEAKIETSIYNTENKKYDTGAFQSKSKDQPQSQRNLASNQSPDLEIYKKHALLLEENNCLNERISKLYQSDNLQDQESCKQNQLISENQKLKEEISKLVSHNQKQRNSQTVKGGESVDYSLTLGGDV
jgi:hypothetical protein